MKVPINWLKKYVELPDNVQEISDKLTSIGHMQDKKPESVANDTVLDLEIRQNRPDCLSMIGVAREASAVFNKRLSVPESYEKDLPKVGEGVTIKVENEKVCRRFDALTFKNVKISDSPQWLVRALETYGIKSINNLVDITNYVMVEIGQPLHAFDSRAFPDNTLIIRSAQENEKFVALGNRELTLTEEDLVIAGVNGAHAIAGVIGGVGHAINESTTDIVLEAANYVQSSIRRTNIRHSIRTEASTRHEKFLDPRLTSLALSRAAELIIELTGAELVGHSDFYKERTEDRVILLNAKNITRLGGVEVSPEEIEDYLTRLGMKVSKKSDEEFDVTVPYFRTDLLQEEDIIEEVIRLYGYEKIPPRLPSSAPPTNIQSKDYDVEEAVRDILVGVGFDEQITEPLTREESSTLDPIMLQNSLNSEKTMLRTTLKNSLERALSHQKKYGKEEIRIFELGKIYYRENKEYKEKKVLACLMSGKKAERVYSEIKGVAKLLAQGHVVVHALLSQKAFYFEVPLDEVKPELKDHIYTSPPHRMYEDFSFVVASDTKVGEIIQKIQDISALIKRVTLGEEPRKMENDKKGVFIKIVFESKDKVLGDTEIEPLRKQIIELLQNNFSATMR